MTLETEKPTAGISLWMADPNVAKKAGERRGGETWLLVVAAGIFVLVVLGGGFLLWRRAQ